MNEALKRPKTPITYLQCDIPIINHYLFENAKGIPYDSMLKNAVDVILADQKQKVPVRFRAMSENGTVLFEETATL